jgi:hypothetical protein
MPTAQKLKPSGTSGKKKDLSALYQKESPATIPIQMPALGIDVELDFKMPDAQVKVWLDEYIIHVARAQYGNTVLTDEQLLENGKNKIINLAAYLRKVALQDTANKAVEEVSGVKNAELVVLRDRMSQLVKDLEYSLASDYEEKEALTFHMTNNEKALEVIHPCIAKCFPEIENPAELTQQIKYVLTLALLGAAGKTIMV